VSAINQRPSTRAARVLRISVASATSLALVALFSCQQRAEDPAASGIGVRIAGTWLGSGEFGDADPIRGEFITTYCSDGTAFATSSRALGAGDPERNGVSNTHHIQWEAMGPRSIRWRLLHFGHHSDGRLRYLSRTHGTVEFDEAFQRGAVAFQVEVYEPEALLDPLDPNSAETEPIFTTRGKGEIRRLLVDGP
jgi:hypothetical protein